MSNFPYNNDMRFLSILCFLGLIPHVSFSQEIVANSTQYRNSLDESLTFQTVTFLPTIDNVNGIYAKPINEKIKELIEKNHHWDFADNKAKMTVTSFEDLVGKPTKVKLLTKNLTADGFFAVEVRKDPKEVKIHLYFFSTQSGALVLEELDKQNSENTNSILGNVAYLFNKIESQLPYDAIIASRVDKRITINAGNQDGVRSGDSLNLMKIVGAKTHPKRGFLISTNKSLVGQARVVKADQHISFADIVSESEPGVVQKGTKVTGISKQSYQNTPWTKQYTPPEQLLSENNKVVFGKKAQEWVAKDPPTFGKVGASFSLGSFDNHLGLASETTINSQVQVFPKIDFNGEVWITPKIYSDVYFAQGIAQSGNPTGSPSQISNSLTQYRISFGYNFILRNEFFGPKLSLDFGFSNYSMFVDSASDFGFTSLRYRSIPMGIGGYVPITASGNWAIGGKAYFHLFPRLKETPFSSGGEPNSTINQFLFYAENKLSERLRWRFGLEFLLLSTSFTGAGQRTIPATNLSHRFTLLNTGVYYLF